MEEPQSPNARWRRGNAASTSANSHKHCPIQQVEQTKRFVIRTSAQCWWNIAKATDRERHRGHKLKIGRILHAAGQVPCVGIMRTDTGTNTLDPYLFQERPDLHAARRSREFN